MYVSQNNEIIFSFHYCFIFVAPTLSLTYLPCALHLFVHLATVHIRFIIFFMQNVTKCLLTHFALNGFDIYFYREQLVTNRYFANI